MTQKDPLSSSQKTKCTLIAAVIAIALVAGAVAVISPAAAQSNSSDVSLGADFPNEVAETDPIVTEYFLTNEGNSSVNKTVQLTINGSVVANETVTVPSGSGTTGTLSYTTQQGDSPSVNAEVRTQSADGVSPASSVVSVADTEGPVFDVNLDNNDDIVQLGDEYSISYFVTNVGDKEGEQEVTLSVGEAPVNTTTVSLEPGETQELDVPFPVTPNNFDTGDTLNINVETTNDQTEVGPDTDQIFVDIDVPSYEVTVDQISGFDGPSVSEPGDQIVVNYTVANAVELSGDYDIEFVVDGEVVDVEENVVLESGSNNVPSQFSGTFTFDEFTGNEQQVNIEIVPVSNEQELEPGESTPASRSVPVDLQPPNFSVDFSAPEEVDEGDEITVDYVINNTGDVQATKPIVFAIDRNDDGNGDVQETRSVTLTPTGDGSTVSDTFTYTAGSEDTPAVTAIVASPDDSATEPIAVNDVSGSFFDVSLDDQTPDSVDLEETNELVVSYVIQNTGDREGTQDIELIVDGEREIVEPDVTLPADPTQTFTGEFVYELDGNDVPNVDVRVQQSGSGNPAEKTVGVVPDAEGVANDEDLLTATHYRVGETTAAQVDSLDQGDAVIELGAADRSVSFADEAGFTFGGATIERADGSAVSLDDDADFAEVPSRPQQSFLIVQEDAAVADLVLDASSVSVTNANGGSIAETSVITAPTTVSLDNTPQTEDVVKGGVIAVETPKTDVVAEVTELNEDDSNNFIQQVSTGFGSQLIVIDSSTRFYDGVDTARLSGDGFTGNLSFRDLGLEVTDSPVELTAGEPIDVAIDAALVERTYEFRAVDAAGEENDILGQQRITSGVRGEASASLLPGATTADDEVFVEVVDIQTGVTVTTAVVTFVETPDVNVAVPSESIEETVGDIGLVAVDHSGTGEFEVELTRENYRANLDVASESDSGTVTVGINYGRAHTLSQAAFFTLSDDTSVSVDRSDSTGIGVELPSGSYTLDTRAFVDGAVDSRSRGQVILQEPQFDSLTTHVAPADTPTPSQDPEQFLEDQTQRTFAATGDTVSLLLDAGGFYGLGDAVTSGVTPQELLRVEQVGDEIDVGESGVGLVFRQADAGLGRSDVVGPQHPDITLRVGDADEYENVETITGGIGTGDQLFAQVDTDGQLFGTDTDDGQIASWNVELVVDPEQYPYIDEIDTISEDDDVQSVLETELLIQDPQVNFNLVRGQTYQLTGDANDTVSGRTNIAPGSGVFVSLTAAEDFATTETVVEQSNNPLGGEFNVDLDLSNFSQNQSLESLTAEVVENSALGSVSVPAAFADTNEADLSGSNEELINENDELREQINRLETNITSLEDELATVREERTALNESLSQVRQDLADREEEIAELSENNTALNTALQEANAEIDRLQNQTDQLNATNAELRAEIQQLESERDDLQEQADAQSDDGSGAGFGIIAAAAAILVVMSYVVYRRRGGGGSSGHDL